MAQPIRTMPQFLQVQAERMTECARESCMLESTFVKDNAQYAEALASSQLKAAAHERITVNDIAEWYMQIHSTALCLTPLAEGKLENFIQQFNSLLNNLTQQRSSDEEKVALIADTLFAFHTMKILEPGSISLACLLANYVVTWVKSPLLIFHPDLLEDEHFAQLGNMRCFIADMFKSAVLHFGKVVTLTKTNGNNSEYVDANGTKVTIQWNTLNKAQAEWQHYAQSKYHQDNDLECGDLSPL